MLLGGCETLDRINAFRTAARSPGDDQVTRASLAQVPYAVAYTAVGKSGRAVMVLGENYPDERIWVSSDQVAIATRPRGRIVRTANLPDNNLVGARFPQPDPVAEGLNELYVPVETLREIDLMPGNRFGLVIEERFEPIGLEQLTLLDLTFPAIRVEGYNRCRALNWEFRNTYWADPHTGLLWKSIQYIAKDDPPVDMEILKPVPL